MIPGLELLSVLAALWCTPGLAVVLVLLMSGAVE